MMDSEVVVQIPKMIVDYVLGGSVIAGVIGLIVALKGLASVIQKRPASGQSFTEDPALLSNLVSNLGTIGTALHDVSVELPKQTAFLERIDRKVTPISGLRAISEKTNAMLNDAVGRQKKHYKLISKAVPTKARKGKK